jgi:hypothetical protein
MTQTREACWHFQCPECGFGDGEFGHLLSADEVYCIVCLEEEGRNVRLRRWQAAEEPNQARLRGGLVAA